ncbi:LOW QUALITY PROTEIN: migration and invasion-inhibitory protein [Pelodytes ibericus]
MSDPLEELRKANKSLLEQLKDRNAAFKELLPTEGRSAMRTTLHNDGIKLSNQVRPSKYVFCDGKENRPLNGFGSVHTARNLNGDKDSLLLSTQGLVSTARQSLGLSRKTVRICEEPGSSRQTLIPGGSAKRCENLTKRAEKVIQIRSPVKRLSFLNCSEAVPALGSREEQNQYPLRQYPYELMDEGNTRTPKSILATPKSRDLKSDAGHVTFQSSSTRNQPELWSVHPFLGYDWIAGVLELNSPIANKSDEFFSEIQEFRRINKEECELDRYNVSEDQESSGSEEEMDFSLDTHECVYCYRVNDRLFTSPIGRESACPICKKRRSRRHPALAEPAFVRVSIPRSTLLPPYKYKAHRRKSFEPTDSLALPSHCLAGWENSVPSSEPDVTGLDLKNSVDPNISAPAPLDHSRLSGTDIIFYIAVFQDNLSLHASRVRSQNLLNMSRSAFFRQSKKK